MSIHNQYEFFCYNGENVFVLIGVCDQKFELAPKWLHHGKDKLSSSLKSPRNGY